MSGEIHPIDKAAGVVIRRLRERAGITQEIMARDIGVKYQQLQKYESGENRVSMSRFFEIAKALRTKPHEIVQLIDFESQAKDF